ncbi:MAG: cytochrome c biogenesis CcdA family protein [Dermatophilaceae bacterium]
MTMDLIPAVALAVSAGAIAAFNPCGFALLPAYLALFLGEPAGRRAAVGRALAVGMAVTVGFVLVFGVAGLLVTALAIGLGDWLSFVTMTSGVLLAVVGVLLLSGREFAVNAARIRLTVDGTPRGMVAYGVVYAVVSLSCTLPVFLAAVITAFTAGSATAGVLALLGYAVGMGAVLVLLSLVTALFGAGAMRRTRGVAPHLKRISGAFLVLAGAYVTWYGWVEYRAFQGDLIPSGPVAWVTSTSAGISSLIAQTGAWLAVGAVVLITAVVVSTVPRRRRTRREDTARHQEERHRSG